MDKVKIIICATFIAFLIMAFGLIIFIGPKYVNEEKESYEMIPEFVIVGVGKNTNIVKDKKTGCLYMQSSRNKNSTPVPYYDKNGEVKGCENGNQNNY